MWLRIIGLLEALADIARYFIVRKAKSREVRKEVKDREKFIHETADLIRSDDPAALGRAERLLAEERARRNAENRN